MEKFEDLSSPPTPSAPPPLLLPPPPLFGSTSVYRRDIYESRSYAAPPALFRTTSNGTSQESKYAHMQYVLTSSRASNQATTNEKDGERILKEEAICRICFKEFEEDNVLKVNCGCPVTLIHEPCAIVWSTEKGNTKCDKCGQEMEQTAVTFLPANPSPPQLTNRKMVKKWCCF